MTALLLVAALAALAIAVLVLAIRPTTSTTDQEIPMPEAHDPDAADPIDACHRCGGEWGEGRYEAGPISVCSTCRDRAPSSGKLDPLDRSTAAALSGVAIVGHGNLYGALDDAPDPPLPYAVDRAPTGRPWGHLDDDDRAALRSWALANVPRRLLRAGHRPPPSAPVPPKPLRLVRCLDAEACAWCRVSRSTSWDRIGHDSDPTAPIVCGACSPFVPDLFESWQEAISHGRRASLLDHLGYDPRAGIPEMVWRVLNPALKQMDGARPSTLRYRPLIRTAEPNVATVRRDLDVAFPTLRRRQTA